MCVPMIFVTSATDNTDADVRKDYVLRQDLSHVGGFETRRRTCSKILYVFRRLQ